VQRWISNDVLTSLKEAEREVGQAIEVRFRDLVAAAQHEGPVEWLAQEGQPNTVLARSARYFDLLLIGQFSEPDEKKRVTVRAEDLVLRSGKPLVIVPNGYEVRAFEEYAAVAWDGSRPAARALADAMQILETKKRLDVVRVGAKGREARPEAVPGRDLIRHLKRHGIDARRISLTASKDGVGSAILGYCGENKPDVLVMGAYGSARLREELFGTIRRACAAPAPAVQAPARVRHAPPGGPGQPRRCRRNRAPCHSGRPRSVRNG